MNTENGLEMLPEYLNEITILKKHFSNTLIVPYKVTRSSQCTVKNKGGGRAYHSDQLPLSNNT